MEKPVVPYRKFATLSGKRTCVAAICVLAVLAVLAGQPMAHAHSGSADVVIPTHLAIDDQIYEVSVGGLRAYIESIKATQPQLYAQLAPDVEHLESQRGAAIAVLVAGLAVGVASTIYAFAGRKACPDPSITDPNFAADSAAWGQCNDDNMTHSATFVFVGMAAAAAGGFGAFAIYPSRSQLLEVVNKNNRLSPTPLRLNLGYDPTHQFAFAGATLSF
jgi:hypothetical protein